MAEVAFVLFVFSCGIAYNSLSKNDLSGLFCSLTWLVSGKLSLQAMPRAGFRNLVFSFEGWKVGQWIRTRNLVLYLIVHSNRVTEREVLENVFLGWSLYLDMYFLNLLKKRYGYARNVRNVQAFMYIVCGKWSSWLLLSWG